MDLKSWILKIRSERKRKKAEKLQEKFSFLMDEIKESESRMAERITTEVEGRVLAQWKEAVQEMNHSMEEMSNTIRGDNSYLQEMVTELKKKYTEGQGVMGEMLESISKKMDKSETKSTADRKRIEMLFHNNAEDIAFRIDELKSLLQLLAVNNLLDEIKIEEIN